MAFAKDDAIFRTHFELCDTMRTISRDGGFNNRMAAKVLVVKSEKGRHLFSRPTVSHERSALHYARSVALKHGLTPQYAIRIKPR